MIDDVLETIGGMASLIVSGQSVRPASSPSAILLVLTLVDIGMIVLIWPEYKRLSERDKQRQE